MMYDYYDEEATIQEADILQAQYERESAEYAALKRRGICTHQSGVGVGDGKGSLEGGAYYAEQVGLTGTQVRCTDGCGRVFASSEEMEQDAEEARYA